MSYALCELICTAFKDVSLNLQYKLVFGLRKGFQFSGIDYNEFHFEY